VITDEDVMRLFERADPARVEDTIPDVDATGYLAILRTRSSNVTLIDTEPTRTGPNTGHRRWLIPVAAAAAVVAIVIGAVVLAGGGGSPEPQIPVGTTVAPPSPEAAAAVQIARDFVVARDTWDGDQVRALLADDAVIDDFSLEAVDDYGTRADFERIMKWRFQHPRCTATEVGPPTAVTCTYLMSNALTTALGVGPFTGSSFVLEVADGQIQRVAHEFDFSQYGPNAFDVLWEWLDGTHPGDTAVMFETDASGDADVVLTPEAMALFEQRIPEFEAVQIAGRYVRARNALNASTARALVADDATIEDNRYTLEGVDDVHRATAEYERVTGWRHQEPRCTTGVVRLPQVEVICRYTMTNALAEAIGAGPYEGSRFDIEVAGGEIRAVSHVFDFTQYSSEVFEPFIGWLDETHPGESEVLFEFGDAGPVGRLTPDALALWEQRIPEWAASLGGS
jgi:hypothetical protein